MNPAIVFLFDPDFYPTGSTTLWLICVGALMGLVAISVLLLVGYLLSFVPVLNRLFENPVSRYVGAGVLTLLILAGCSPSLSSSYRVWQIVDSENAIGNIAELLVFLLPCIYLFSLSLLAICSRNLMVEIWTAIREGVLFWITIFASILAVGGITGLVFSGEAGFGSVQIVSNATSHVESMQRWPSTFSPVFLENEIPIDQEEGTGIDFNFDTSEIRDVAIQSDSLIRISALPFKEEIEGQIDDTTSYVELDSDTLNTPFRLGGVSLPAGEMTTLFIKNLGESPANVNLIVEQQPAIPQVGIVFYTAAGMVCLYLFYLLMRVLVPKISAISLSTFKTETSQPLFLVLMLSALVLLFVFVYVPYNTLGEDIKILKDSGLTLILVFSIFMAVWAASKSIAEEIEGRTALTVLSKPVGRRQFIVGKFLGIAWAVGLLFVILGVWFLCCVAYKPVYDAVETSQGEIPWTICFEETVRIVPGLVLAYFETLIFVAISVVISTRLPIMANLMICLIIYVLGHLTPLLVQSSVAAESFETVVFVGRLLAVILPVLDHFNIQAAVSGGTDVPMVYLGWSAVYCMIYGTIALLLALVLFEDRDLA